MSQDILFPATGYTNFTCTLAGLTSGSARQTTLVSNTSSPKALAQIFVQITSGGTGPTAGTVYEVYLLRGSADGTDDIRDDGAGASDAAITIENAPLLGVILVTNTASKAFKKVFDTRGYELGPQWGIAIRNATNQAIHITEANHKLGYRYIYPQIQAAA